MIDPYLEIFGISFNENSYSQIGQLSSSCEIFAIFPNTGLPFFSLQKWSCSHLESCEWCQTICVDWNIMEKKKIPNNMKAIFWFTFLNCYPDFCNWHKYLLLKLQFQNLSSHRAIDIFGLGHYPYILPYYNRCNRNVHVHLYGLLHYPKHT